MEAVIRKEQKHQDFDYEDDESPVHFDAIRQQIQFSEAKRAEVRLGRQHACFEDFQVDQRRNYGQ